MHKRFLTYDKHNPPAGVNAAGMMGADVVVEVVEDYKNATGSTPIKTVKLIRGSYAALEKKITKKEWISGRILLKKIQSDYTEHLHISIDSVSFVEGENIALFGGPETNSDGGGYHVNIYPDDAVD